MTTATLPERAPKPQTAHRRRLTIQSAMREIERLERHIDTPQARGALDALFQKLLRLDEGFEADLLRSRRHVASVRRRGTVSA